MIWLIALGVVVVWGLCAVASTRVKLRREQEACQRKRREIERQERMVKRYQ